MSLIEIEFIKTNERYVKYEDEHKLELDEISSTADNCEDDNYTAKCGEVFVSNSGKFSFLCTFCDDRFKSINLFVQHMQRDHLSSTETQESLEDPIMVDNDDQITAEVKSEAHSEDEFESVACDNRTKNHKTAEATDTDYFKDFRAFLDKTLGGNHEYDDDGNDDSGASLKSSNSTSSKYRKKARPDLYCKPCNRQYFTKTSFEKHKSRHEDHFYSEDSFEDFAGSDSDFEVKGTEVNRSTNPLTCRYCRHQFKDKSARISHERIHTGEKPFSCEHCSKCFRTKRLLANHVMIHTGERPHKCDYCGSAFTHKMNLIVHIRAHLGDKRFKCEFCDKRFVRNVDRRIHMRTHTGEKPYQCDRCGTSFSTSSKLTEHRKRHTNTRPFQCNECGKSFFSKNLLKNHAVCHSDERPYECEICFSAFPRKRALQSHIKIHSDVKEYVCAICDKAFAQNAGLYCHMKSHGVRVTKKLISEFEEEALSAA